CGGWEFRRRMNEGSPLLRAGGRGVGTALGAPDSAKTALRRRRSRYGALSARPHPARRMVKASDCVRGVCADGGRLHDAVSSPAPDLRWPQGRASFALSRPFAASTALRVSRFALRVQRLRVQRFCVVANHEAPSTESRVLRAPYRLTVRA